MQLKPWLGMLAMILISAAVVLATIVGRTVEAAAYLVVLLVAIGTNAALWRRDRST